jgi:hypothetical protein
VANRPTVFFSLTSSGRRSPTVAKQDQISILRRPSSADLAASALQTAALVGL